MVKQSIGRVADDGRNVDIMNIIPTGFPREKRNGKDKETGVFRLRMQEAVQHEWRSQAAQTSEENAGNLSKGKGKDGRVGTTDPRSPRSGLHKGKFGREFLDPWDATG